MTTMTSLENRFDEIIEKLHKTSHGSEAFRELKQFFSPPSFKKAAQREEFLSARILQAGPIEWASVKDHVWRSRSDREKNRFPFLQGDINRSDRVGPRVFGPYWT